MEDHGFGFHGIPGHLGHVVQDTVFVVVFLFFKGDTAFFGRILSLPPEEEVDILIDHGLPAEHIGEILSRDINLGKHVQVGFPVDDGTGAVVSSGHFFLHVFGGGIPLGEGDGTHFGAVIGGYMEEFAGVLGSACPQAVEPQGILVGGTVRVIVVLTAGVEFVIDQLPVIALFLFVPVQGNPTSEVLHLNGVIPEGSDHDGIPEAFSGFIHGIGEDFEHGMLAAFQPVGAEDNGGAFSDSVRAFQGGNGLVIILCLCLFFHSV